MFYVYLFLYIKKSQGLNSGFFAFIHKFIITYKHTVICQLVINEYMVEKDVIKKKKTNKNVQKPLTTTLKRGIIYLKERR